MNDTSMRIAVSLAIGALSLVACGGSGSTPMAAAAIQASSVQISEDGAIRNVSGQYHGTIKDSVHGKSKASADLAQYNSAVGGTLMATDGTQSTTSSGVFILNGTALRGTGVLSSGSVVCSFAEAAKYDASTHQLIGSYHAVHGCSGETGTYTMKEKCYYPRDEVIRRDNGPKPC